MTGQPQRDRYGRVLLRLRTPGWKIWTEISCMSRMKMETCR